MSQAGLLNARLNQANSWEADGAGGNPIFVDGPFVDHNAAVQDGLTLQGVEDVATGGLYVVSAPMTANLGVSVKAVADCLALAVGQGTLPAG